MHGHDARLEALRGKIDAARAELDRGEGLDGEETLEFLLRSGVEEDERGEGIPGDIAFQQARERFRQRALELGFPRAAERPRPARDANSPEASAMNIFLPPELERLIDERIKSGKYGSKEEVIEEALRLLDERDRAYQAHLDALREKLRVGREQLERGEYRAVEEAIAYQREKRRRAAS